MAAKAFDLMDVQARIDAVQLDQAPPWEQVPLGAYADEPAAQIREPKEQLPKKSEVATESERAIKGPVTLDDFQAYMPLHQYIFKPSRELWPASSVNARLSPVDFDGKTMKPSDWLDKHQACEQMTWAPGEPMIIEDRLISNGGAIKRDGARVFNLYIPPCLTLGKSELAAVWCDHIRKIYPEEATHIIKWFAHRVQRPGEKLNHALVLGGNQGIGKDTMLEPVKYAVGAWNFNEVSPAQMLGRFNSFVKSVILRISEARDNGDSDRYAFYDHLKVFTAAPPDVLRCDEKHLREHAVMNVCGVIITTNHKGDGIFLPPDDRRHFVAWSDKTKEDFPPDYWRKLYGWYANGGMAHVAAYLSELDLSDFDPKAPPPKTPAFWEIVDSNRSSENAELADALDKICNPDAFTLGDLQNPLVNTEFREWIGDRRNRRVIPHKIEEAGYVPVRNETAGDGLWKLDGKRQVIYARKELSLCERLSVANTRRLGGAS